MTFDKFFLSSGKPYIYKNMVVKHPTLSDILSIDNNSNTNPENEYWGMVMSLLCEPYNYMVELYDNGIDYETIHNFDMFVFNWQKLEKLYLLNKEQFDLIGLNPLQKIKSNLTVFLGKKHNFELTKSLSDEYLLVDANNDKYIIDREMYTHFVEFLKAINKLDFKDRINPANETTKLMLIEDMREEQELRQKNKTEVEIDVLNNMKIAVCSTVGSVGFHNVYDLHIYQLYSLFNMFNSYTRFNNMLGGVYGGMVSSDAFSKKDWDWTNI